MTGPTTNPVLIVCGVFIAGALFAAATALIHHTVITLANWVDRLLADDQPSQAIRPDWLHRLCDTDTRNQG